jgi:hypothetical protein
MLITNQNSIKIFIQKKMVRKKLALEILNNIKKEIKLNYQNEKNSGVLVGSAGILLFNFYYDLHIKKINPVKNFLKELNVLIEKINVSSSLTTFCSGITGLLWVIDFINFKYNLGLDIDEEFNEIELVIYDKLKNDFSNKNFDFLHGGLGYSNYFLNRYKHTDCSVKKSKYLKYLIESFNFLKNNAITIDNKTKWSLPLDEFNKKRIYNFGLAHGIPSIIYFLIRLNENNILVDETNILIEKSIDYLLSNKLENNISIFPTAIVEDKNYNINKDFSRLAWCYGDLGVINTILMSTKLKKHNGYLMELYEPTIHQCSRNSFFDQNIITDSPICHGSFGVYYMLKKINSYYNDVKVKDAYKYWFEKGISEYKINGISSFSTVNSLNDTKILETSILEGISGIGMLIISEITEEFDNNWDECLMLSI